MLRYVSGIYPWYPKSKIKFDKFHVMKLVNEAVDEVRKKEQKTAGIGRTKYLWLKNERNLNAEQREALIALKDLHLNTGRAYLLKLALKEFWTSRHIFADGYFREWMGWEGRSKLEPMMKLAKTLNYVGSQILSRRTEWTGSSSKTKSQGDTETLII